MYPLLLSLFQDVSAKIRMREQIKFEVLVEAAHHAYGRRQPRYRLCSADADGITYYGPTVVRTTAELWLSQTIESTDQLPYHWAELVQ